ncbi:MAG: phosphatase PAP2 family protein [Bacteroidales bacterium]|nr:phosphatase PAP2 family protein [Bacteroidales bacterium]
MILILYIITGANSQNTLERAVEVYSNPATDELAINTDLSPLNTQGKTSLKISPKASKATPLFTEKPKIVFPWTIVIPSALISYGVITRFSVTLQNFDKNINNKVSQDIHKKYPFDDYIQYAPYIGIYAPDLFGVKAKHSLIDRTLVLGSSMIICASIVQSSKRLTSVTRPDGSNNRSFPSGHTATAFLGAHILFREYKETLPWLGITGYIVAATTGAMRIINRKHWFSDVIAGAGVGIISVELSYLMLPIWHRIFKKKNNYSLAVSPWANQNCYGLGATMVF